MSLRKDQQEFTRVGSGQRALQASTAKANGELQLWKGFS